jgi:uncharacterized membrane protein
MSMLKRIARACGGFGLRRWQELSMVGVIFGILCFAASLTPSLLPRQFPVQGALSGLAFAVGYGAGRLIFLTWQFLEIPLPRARLQRLFKWSISLAALVIAVAFLTQITRWQNSIRALMDMEPEASAYPIRVALIAIVAGAVFITCGRGIEALWRLVNRRLERLIPRRVSLAVSAVLVTLLLVLTVNKVFARFALRTADQAFLELDKAIDEDHTIPVNPLASGSSESLIQWDSIGRRGKNFIARGPTQADISQFLGRPAKQPIRVYAGFRSSDDIDARAQLAFEELKRVGGFDRSILIVATPTGTGWLDENAVDTVEYLHAGDTAIVAMGYSYLPSWMTLLVDPDRSRTSARALFSRVYGYWKTLPHDRRPKLYLHGLSLGSLGAESCADLFTLIGDPIQGGVFSGPPFPSTMWNQITHDRNPDSPVWMPRFQDGSVVRFTGRQNALNRFGDRWGPIRFVYIQHPSDPMTFFSTDMLYREPDWLQGKRGPDVSPELRWHPVITFLQVGFDLTTSTSVPLGFGHKFDAPSYIDAWIAVTDPPNWTADDTRRLKAQFAASPAKAPRLSSP